MFSRTRVKKLNDSLKEMTLTTGLTDEQIAFLKNKFSVIELWKDTAVDKFTQVDNTLDTAQNIVTGILSRLVLLETKATQFQTALVNLAARVKALEDRLR